MRYIDPHAIVHKRRSTRLCSSLCSTHVELEGSKSQSTHFLLRNGTTPMYATKKGIAGERYNN